MEIIALIKLTLYYILLILIFIDKKMKEIIRIIEWFKSLFTKKQAKPKNETITSQIASNALTDPKTPPPKRPVS